MSSNGAILSSEPVLHEKPGRLAIKPIEFPEVWSFYKRLQSNTWTAEEITFKDDIQQISSGMVDDETMAVLQFVLGLFSGADKVVNDNLAVNMLGIVKMNEAEVFYGQQIQNENVHNETYSNTIEVYYKDQPELKDKVLHAVETMPCITKLLEWAQNWIKKDATDVLTEHHEALCRAAESLGYGPDKGTLEELAFVWRTAMLPVAFACIEGVVFSAAFCVIFWIKQRGLLPGLTFSNELISADEGLHRDFACLLFRMLKNKPPKDMLVAIVRECVEFEEELVKEMFPKPLLGMNADQMTQYVHFTADSLCTQLGYGKVYDVANPFQFMENISINGITNFFEKRVAEYSLSGFEGDKEEDDELVLEDDDY